MKKRIKTLINRIKNLEPRVRYTVYIFIIFAFSSLIIFNLLGKNKSDLRGALPAESLAFIELRDIGSLLRSMTENSGEKRVRDFSFFDGMEIAIAISGFETTEQELTGEQSILNLRFKFGAVFETYGWSWQTKGFIDGQLGEFVTKELGDGVRRSTKKVEYGSQYIWTAADGRKIYALAEGSRIYFGNDEPFLESCLAAARGKSKSLKDDAELESFYARKTGDVIVAYLPRRAITKFAGIAGVSAAVSGSEESGVRGFISRVVPQLLENSVDSIHWTAKKTSAGIEDEIELNTKREVAEVFAETMRTGSKNREQILRFVPDNAVSLTKYNMRDPRIAYRSLILVAGNRVDTVSANLLNIFSQALLGSYGITDPELFLDSSDGEVITLELDDADGSSAALAAVKDKDKILEVLAKDIGTSEDAESIQGGEYWSGGESYAAAIVDGILITGDKKAVESCLKPNETPATITKVKVFESLLNSTAPVATVAKDTDSYSFLFEPGSSQQHIGTNMYFSETSFGRNGIVRRYQSKFGLIGSILSRISAE